MKFAAGSTQVRVAPPSRERLLRLAEAGARICRQWGYSSLAAICEALILALAQNLVLRREVKKLRAQLAGAREPIDGPEAWSDERTKQADAQSYPVLVARSTRTDLHKIARPDHDD